MVSKEISEWTSRIVDRSRNEILSFWYRFRGEIRIAVILVVLLTYSITILRIRTPWADELYTQQAIQEDWSQVFSRLQPSSSDAAHLLYYSVVKIFSEVTGSSITSIRFVSIAAIMLSAIGIYLLAQSMWNEQVALFSLIAFATLPIVARYATEARSGAIVMAVSCWVMLAFWRMGRKQEGLVWPTLYVVLSIASIWFFVFASLLVVVQWLWVIGSRSERRRYRKYSLALIPITLASFPLVWISVQQRGNLSFPETGFFKGIIQSLTFPFGHGARFSTLLLACFSLGLILFAVLRTRFPGNHGSPRTESSILLLLGWYFAPALILNLVSLMLPVFTSRYTLMSVPAAAILLGWSIRALPQPLIRIEVGTLYLLLATSASFSTILNNQ